MHRILSLAVVAIWLGMVAELLSMFGLSDWSDELVEGFSHGMRQRLVMASALLHEPIVLVVDEMRGRAELPGSALEEVFIKLTGEGACK